MINVVVVDDQRLIYEGFSALLSMHEDLNCLKTFSSGEDFLKEAKGLNADVILMDIRMPEMNGIDAIRRFREFNSSTRVLMLTTFNDREYIIEAIKAGANGYMLKDTPFEKIVEAIQTVHTKGAYLLDVVTATVLDYMQKSESESSHEISWKERYELSSRELEVMYWIKKGLSNYEISQKLFISQGTVKNHVSNIMDKLDLRERHLLIIYALSGIRPDSSTY